jgi:capsular polysaccharide biosynthesis protein
VSSDVSTDAVPGAVAGYEPWLTALDEPVTDVVLLLRDDVAEVANGWVERFPHARVHVLGARNRELPADDSESLHPDVDYVVAPSQQSRVDHLLRLPRPQVMVEAGSKKRAHKLTCFRQLFFFVAPGGLYAVEELDVAGDPRYDEGDGETVNQLIGQVAALAASSAAARTAAKTHVAELAAAAAAITVEGTRAVLRRSAVSHWRKLRDWEADDVLTRRYGDAWGEVVEHRPAHTFLSRGEVTSYGDGPIASGRKVYDVPDRFLRRYRDVAVTARQIVRYADYVLPDSWRHPHQRVLNNRQLVHCSPYSGRYLDRTAPTSVRELDGPHYYLDTELPRHFGHLTTDVISRVWAWEQVRALEPDVRCLVSVDRPPLELPGYQLQILAALGIPTDRLEIVGPHEEVRVPVLYGPTPQLENPTYVDPDLAEVWRRLGDGLPPGASAHDDKIFVSRRPSDKRHCVQTPEIEKFFAGQGFRILFPEDHPYVDQKMIFARAKVIAGLGGSGLFTMMFNPTATIVIISGSSYTAENERLIAAANGNDVHYFWGTSAVPMPAGRFSMQAFASSFTFDLRRHRRALRKIIG